MRTLYLLRHAHAAGRGAGASDHDRGLSEAGRSAAAGIGALLAERTPAPEIALCSSARRARETLAAVREFLGDTLEVHCEAGLYLAASETLLERIGAVADDRAALLVVGHNPGIGQLAADLAPVATAGDAARLRHGFPPAALVRLTFDVERWCDLAPRRARQVELAIPRRPASTR